MKSDSYLIERIPVALYLTKFKVPALIISLPLTSFNSNLRLCMAKLCFEINNQIRKEQKQDVIGHKKVL